MRKIFAIAYVAGVLAVPGTVVSGAAAAHEQLAYNMPEPVPAAHGATLDLARLESRLRDTAAIGVWSKLQLEGRLTDILHSIGRHQDGSGGESLEAIRAQFFALADETAARLRRGDPGLSKAIATSREAIWEAVLQR